MSSKNASYKNNSIPIGIELHLVRLHLTTPFTAQTPSTLREIKSSVTKRDVVLLHDSTQIFLAKKQKQKKSKFAAQLYSNTTSKSKQTNK